MQLGANIKWNIYQYHLQQKPYQFKHCMNDYGCHFLHNCEIEGSSSGLK